MFKYFFTSLAFWAFTPIACVLCVIFFVLGVFGFGESFYNLLQFVIPTGLPLIFGRLFVVFLMVGLICYFFWLLFKLVLVCIDNGIRGFGFLIVLIFFLVRAFIRYYTAGIVMQGLLIMLYEALVEFISFFYFSLWSISRYIQKKSFFRYTMYDITYERFLISKVCFNFLNLPFIRNFGFSRKYRKKFGFYCYTYILRTEVLKRRIPLSEKRELFLKYIGGNMFNVFELDVINSKQMEKRKFLFLLSDWAEDEEFFDLTKNQRKY